MKLQQTSLALISASMLATVSAREHLISNNAFVLDDDTASKLSQFSASPPSRFAKRDFNIADRPETKKAAQIPNGVASSFEKLWSSLATTASRVESVLEQLVHDSAEEVEVVWASHFGSTNNGNKVKEEKKSKKPAKTGASETAVLQVEPDMKHKDQQVLDLPTEQKKGSDKDTKKSFGKKESEEDSDESDESDDDSDDDYEDEDDSDDEDEDEVEHESPKSGKTFLTTALSRNPSISQFYRYLRSSKCMSSRIENGNKYTIVFAPTNEAIESMEKKPWNFLVDPDTVNFKDLEHDKKFKHYYKKGRKGKMTEEKLAKLREKKMQHIIDTNIESFLSPHIVKMASQKDSKKHSSGSLKTPNLGDFKVGKMFESQSGATLVVAASEDPNPNSLTVHSVDVDGTKHTVNVLDTIQAKNGIVYIIDNFLVSV